MSADDIFPQGRVVFYEGDDPEGFAKEMAALGIDIEAQPPDDIAAWLNRANWKEIRSFFIPPGRLEEIYNNDRWLLGS